jgi:hypothetical protein
MTVGMAIPMTVYPVRIIGTWAMTIQKFSGRRFQTLPVLPLSASTSLIPMNSFVRMFPNWGPHKPTYRGCVSLVHFLITRPATQFPDSSLTPIQV